MGMDEERGIYVDTGRILAVLGYEEDGDEEEEVDS